MSGQASTSTDDKGKEGEVSSSCDSSTVSSDPVEINDAPSVTVTTESTEREQNTVFESADTSIVVAEPTISETDSSASCDVTEIVNLVTTCTSSPIASSEECDNNISTTCELKLLVESGACVESASDSNVTVPCLRESSSPGQSVRENDIISTSRADSTTTSMGSAELETSECQEKEISTTGGDTNPVSTSFVTPTSLALALNQCVHTEKASSSNISGTSTGLACDAARADISKSQMDGAQGSGISTTSMIGTTQIKSREPCQMSNQSDVLPSTSQNSIRQSDSNSQVSLKLVKMSDPVSSSRDVDKLHSFPPVMSRKLEKANIDTTSRVSLHRTMEHSRISISAPDASENNGGNNTRCTNATSCSNVPSCDTSILPQDVTTSSTCERTAAVILEPCQRDSDDVEVQAPPTLSNSAASAHCEVSTSVNKQDGTVSTADFAGNKASPSLSSLVPAQSPETSYQTTSTIPAASSETSDQTTSTIPAASSETSDQSASTIPAASPETSDQSASTIPAATTSDADHSIATCLTRVCYTTADCVPNVGSDCIKSADKSEVRGNTLSLKDELFSSHVVESPTGSSANYNSPCSSELPADIKKPQDAVSAYSNPEVSSINTKIVDQMSGKEDVKLVIEELKACEKESNIISSCESKSLCEVLEVSHSDGSTISFASVPQCVESIGENEKSQVKKPISSLKPTVQTVEIPSDGLTTSVTLPDVTVGLHKAKEDQSVKLDSDLRGNTSESSDPDAATGVQPKPIGTFDQGLDSDSCDITTLYKDMLLQTNESGMHNAASESVKDVDVQEPSRSLPGDIYKLGAVSAVQEDVALEVVRETREKRRKVLYGDCALVKEPQGTGIIGDGEIPGGTACVPDHPRSNTTPTLSAAGEGSKISVMLSKLIRPVTVTLTDISKLDVISLETGATVIVKDLLCSSGSVSDSSNSDLKSCDLPVPKVILSRLKSEVTFARTAVSGREQQESRSTEPKDLSESQETHSGLEGVETVTVGERSCQEGNSEGLSSVSQENTSNKSDKHINDPHTTEKPAETGKVDNKMSEVSEQRLTVNENVSVSAVTDTVTKDYMQQEDISVVEVKDIQSHSESDKEKLHTTLETPGTSQAVCKEPPSKIVSVVDVVDTPLCNETDKTQSVTVLETSGESEICNSIDNPECVETTVVTSCDLVKEQSAAVLKLNDSQTQSCQDVDIPDSSSCVEDSGRELLVTAIRDSGDLQVSKEAVENSNSLSSQKSGKEEMSMAVESADVSEVCKEANKHAAVLPSSAELAKSNKDMEVTDSTAAVIPDQKSTSPVTCAPTSGAPARPEEMSSRAILSANAVELKKSVTISRTELLNRNVGKVVCPSLITGTAKQVAGSSDSSEQKEDKLVEKITLKLKKDGADAFIATQKKIKIPTDCVSEKSSVTEKETHNPEKITLKLKKYSTKSDAFIVSSNEKPSDILLDGSSSSSEKCPERITLKLKKHSSNSEQFVLSLPSEAVMEDTTTKITSKQVGNSRSVCEEPPVEKITLKRMKDGSNSDVFIATSSKDVDVQDTEDKAAKNTSQKMLQLADKVVDDSIDGNDLTAISGEHSHVTSKVEIKNEDVSRLDSEHSQTPGCVVDCVEGVQPSPEVINVPGSSEHELSSLLEPSKLKIKGDSSELPVEIEVPAVVVTPDMQKSALVSATLEVPSVQIRELGSSVELPVDRQSLASVAKYVGDDESKNVGHTSENKQHVREPELGTKVDEIKEDDQAKEFPQTDNKGEMSLKRKADAKLLSPLAEKKLKNDDKVVAPENKSNADGGGKILVPSGVEIPIVGLELVEKKTLAQNSDSIAEATRQASVVDEVQIGSELEGNNSLPHSEIKESKVVTSKASSDVADKVFGESIVGDTESEQMSAVIKIGTGVVKIEEINPLIANIVQEDKILHCDQSFSSHTSKHEMKAEVKGPVISTTVPKTTGDNKNASVTVAKLTSKKPEHVNQTPLTKADELPRSDENKPGKITLTLKKSAAWSVKQPHGQCATMLGEGIDKVNSGAGEVELVEVQDMELLDSGKQDGDHNYTAAPAPIVKRHMFEEKFAQNVQLHTEGSAGARPKKIVEKRMFETIRTKECSVKRVRVDSEKFALTSARAASTSKAVARETRPHKKEEISKPSVEDKLRQILSRMGSKVSSVFNNEVSITLTAPKSSAKASATSNLKFSDPCEIEVTPEVNIIGSEVDVVAEGEDSNSQDIVILEEKIFSRKPPSGMMSIESMDSQLLKKARGRPRKTEAERHRQPALPSSPAVLLSMPTRPKRMCRGREEKPLSQPKAKKPRISGIGRGRKKQLDVGPGSITGARLLPPDVRTETGLKPSTMAALLKTVSIVKIKPPSASQAVISTPSHISSMAKLSSCAPSTSRPTLVVTSVPSTKHAPRTFSRVTTTAHVRSVTVPTTSARTSSIKSRGIAGVVTTPVTTTITAAVSRKLASVVTTITPVVTTSVTTSITKSPITTTDITANVTASITTPDVATVASDTASPSVCTGIFTPASCPDATTNVTGSSPPEVTSTSALLTPGPGAVSGAIPLPAPPGSPCPAPVASSVQVFEEETRMSAESNSRSQTPARSLPTTAAGDVVGEESQGSVVSTATTESNKNRKNRMEIPMDTDNIKEFTVDMLAEYSWPPDKNGEHLMVQEQISQYLGVKSFKRKYPDIRRRPVEAEEKTYLREKGLVSEYLSDLGLTAVVSAEILDIMYTDFQEKYEEYRRHMRDRQAKEFSSKQKAISAVTSGEKSKQDYKEKAVSSAAAWNCSFNRSRKEDRRCSFDLQNFSIHYPQNRRRNMTLKDMPKVGCYPISLIPGQYTDYYKRYTPTELRYFPLNTILYGPMKPNERQEIKGSDGSQSDSDDSSSSDSSSSCSSEETQDTEDDSGSSEADGERLDSPGGGGGGSGGAQPLGGKAEGEGEKKAECPACKVCQGGRTRNKDGRPEILIHCGQCGSSSHPTCLDLTLDMVPHIKRYNWQCTDCKTCVQCKDPADEDKMLFCDMCDRGYHIYCVGLRRVPTGRWHCKECAVCGSCGTHEPGGINTEIPNAQWQHEYKKGDKGARVYAQTLCVPCSKLWRKGRYCQLCWRCYVNKPDEEEGLVNCSVCDKWMHAECCSAIGGKEVDCSSNFLCEICQEKGQARSTTIKVIPRTVIKV